MNKLIDKFGKKKTIIFAVSLFVILAAAIVIICFLAGSGQKNVSVEKSEGYASVAAQSSLTEAEVDKKLSGYTKTESAGSATYTKDKEKIQIKTDSNGKVIYKSYEKEMGDNEQAKIGNFNESKIKIGMEEKKVLALLSKYNYVYNLIATDSAGKPLHIFYYGWTGSKAALELVFTAGKLTYYTINSADLAHEVEPPEVK